MAWWQQENEGGADDTAWLVALGVLCAAIVGYGVFFSTNIISDPAFLAGRYLVYTLGLWGAFYAVFLRNKGAKLSGIAFAAIFLALFVGGLIAASRQKQMIAESVSVIQQEMNRVADAVARTDGVASKIDQRPTLPPTANGELGEMERFTMEFLGRMVAQRNDYFLELDAIGWDSILDAQRIKDDVTLSESKVMLKRANSIVDKYERKTAALIEDARTDIRALNLSESVKESMLAGFEGGLAQSSDEIDKVWKLEKQIVQQIENIILLLSVSRNWTVEGEHILFYNDADLARFNTYVATIQTLVWQQEQIQAGNLDEVNRNFDALKEEVQ